MSAIKAIGPGQGGHPAQGVELQKALGAAGAKAGKPVDPALRKAAEEFESALVRQLLQSVKLGGKQAQQGYGAMAVDALASGLQAGGGLGLAKAIEDAVTRGMLAKGK